MNQTERLYRIDQLLRERGVVPFRALCEALEISRATVKRDLAHLRERLNAPIEFDRDAGGYRLRGDAAGPRYQLPGLWFSADEVLALMTMHQMLDGLDAAGLLGPQIQPLMQRLEKVLGGDAANAREVIRRIKLLPAQTRRVNLKWFGLVGRALVKRQRLRIDYYSRHRDQRAWREISPQRLVHYRGNWYLDAWCHRTDGVRMFAIDAIEHASVLPARARAVSLREVDEGTAGGYGIYRGTALRWATLRFAPEAARWVRAQIWHPQQQGRDRPDGSYELRLPYAQPAELEMDILRHGEHVEVLAPAALRAAIRTRLALAAARYGPPAAPAPDATRDATPGMTQGSSAGSTGGTSPPASGP